MKVVKREELINMPYGTIYSDFNDGIISGFYKKLNTNDEKNDWKLIDILNPLFGENTSEYLNEIENGIEIEYEHSEEMDADFDDSNLYIIFSKKDLKAITKLLK